MEKNKPGIVRKTDTYTERFVLFLSGTSLIGTHGIPH